MSASPLDSLQNIIGAAKRQLDDLDALSSAETRRDGAIHAFYGLVAAIVAEARWLSADPAVSAEHRASCVHLMRRYAELLDNQPNQAGTPKAP